jgi:hypothetical protein
VIERMDTSKLVGSYPAMSYSAKFSPSTNCFKNVMLVPRLGPDLLEPPYVGQYDV